MAKKATGKKPLTRVLIATGLRKGVMGGSRPWLVLALATGTLRGVRRLLVKEPEVVYSETLEPGQKLVITHLRGDAPGS